MADDVVIGSASVQIVGDYSGLEKSFNASQSLAQAAGQKISAALESSAAGAGALTNAINTVGNSIDDLASKSGLAGGELNLFRAALQGSLDAGVPVNEALKDMAASSQTLGTSVASASQNLLKEAEAADAAAQALKQETTAADAAAGANQQASTSFANLGQSATQTNAEFEKFADGIQNFISHPLQSAGAAAKSFLIELGPLGTVALGVTAIIAGLGKEVFNLVEQFGQAAKATGNMADRLNLTWRETRNLEEMAQIAGVSIGGLQTASFRLAEALEGTSKQGQDTAAALLKIGVTGATSGELLSGFLAKLAEIPDDTQRIALAHEVLGRSSQQILPLIKNYAELQEAIQHLGPAITSEMAEKLKASDDALDRLSISWNRFKEGIAVFAAPGVQRFVDLLTALVAGGTLPAIDRQIQDIEAKMVSLGEKSALAGWLMADGFTKGKEATLEALKAQREHLVGVEQAIERSKEYNAEIQRSNAEAAKATAARKAAAEAAAEAAREQYNAMVGFNNSVIVLYNSIPATYSKYVDSLSDGGKTAKSMLASVEADIQRASTLMEGMRGAPLAAMQEWVRDLQAAHDKLKDFAADDAFNQLAVKFGELQNKFGPQMAEQVGVIKDRFDQLAEAAKNVPGVFDNRDELTLQRQLLEAQKQMDDQTQKTGEHFAEAWEKYHGGIVKAQDKTVEITASLQDRLPQAFKASYDESIHLQESFKMLGITGVSAAGDMQGKWVSAFEDVVSHSKSLTEVEAAWGAIGGKVNQLAKTNLPEAIRLQNEYIDALSRTGAPIGEIIAEEEKELQLEIRMNTQRGQSSNSQIIALANMRAGTAALNVLNNSLAMTYVELGQTIQGAIAPLSGAIAQLINGAGSFYKAWHQAMNQFEAQLVSVVIQAVIKYGVAWVTAHVLGTAASTAHATAEMAGITATSTARAAATAAQLVQITAVTAAQTAAIATVTAEQMASFVAIRAASTALDVADVLGYAAVAGAAAFASTAAIPIVGPILAPEAGALAYATVAATYAPLATFSEGGMVPEDMIAMVHKGEYVLNAEKTASAMVGGGGNGKGEIHVHFDFGGAHFSNGLNDTQVKTVFDRAFRMSKLAGALPAGRFPQ